MALKPQDIVVALKLCGYAGGSRSSYLQIGAELSMSPSEIHGAVRRLKLAGLINGKEMDEAPNLTALEEFLFHGVKYSFPAEFGALTRGMPTSYATAPLNLRIKAGDDPVPVWPDADGTVRGVSLKPLYKTVPAAAKRDPLLYSRLALVDAIRSGRARDRQIAQQELIKSLNKANE